VEASELERRFRMFVGGIFDSVEAGEIFETKEIIKTARERQESAKRLEVV